MDAVWLGEVVPALGMAIALAACAGLRAWLPLLLGGCLVRAGLVEVGPTFQFIASDRALLLFGAATAIEILADKVPAVDHALDLVSTVLRPAAASLLAASLFGPFSDPLTAWVLGIAVGAPASLVPHAAKSTLRAASSAFTAGLANPVLSLAEDLLAVVLFVVAVLLPLLAGALVALAAALIVRRLLRRRSRAVAAAAS